MSRLPGRRDGRRNEEQRCIAWKRKCRSQSHIDGKQIKHAAAGYDTEADDSILPAPSIGADEVVFSISAPSLRFSMPLRARRMGAENFSIPSIDRNTLVLSRIDKSVALRLCSKTRLCGSGKCTYPRPNALTAVPINFGLNRGVQARFCSLICCTPVKHNQLTRRSKESKTCALLTKQRHSKLIFNSGRTWTRGAR